MFERINVPVLFEKHLIANLPYRAKLLAIQQALLDFVGLLVLQKEKSMMYPNLLM